MLFLSSHIDDAIVSAGGVIAMCAEKNDIYICTFFSESNWAPNTKFHCKNHAKVTEIRKLEEKILCLKFGLNYGFLDLPDALIRNPEKYYCIKNKEDYEQYFEESIRKSIISKMEDLFLRNFDLIFVPMGTGNHVDHLIINKYIKKYFIKDYQKNIFFYEDMPYSLYNSQNKNRNDTKNREFVYKEILIELAKDEFRKKLDMISVYQSQSHKGFLRIVATYAYNMKKKYNSDKFLERYYSIDY